ncbi:MAG: alpha/beta hydrolase [Oscillospiraceae bacterium]|nr:alpha/beta hydrolase [Oscillospiraceae bacterium]
MNKVKHFALRLISRAEPRIRDTYRLQRAAADICAPHFMRGLYRLRDRKIRCGGHSVPVRIHEPKEFRSEQVILFFHGGGWATENIDTYHRICESLADRLGRAVLSVDYRLAPEHPFPAGLEDCYAAAEYLFRWAPFLGLRPEDIVLMGDSAGGNLAAAVSLMARNKKQFSVKRQILIYPAVSGDYSEDSAFLSVRENGEDYILTSKRLQEYLQMYIRDPEDLKDPYVAPLLTVDLSGQPDTLIVTAQYDPLRDEGEAYGERLKEAGNRVRILRMEDALHGFLSMPPRFSHVKQTYRAIEDFLGGEADA